MLTLFILEIERFKSLNLFLKKIKTLFYNFLELFLVYV